MNGHNSEVIHYQHSIQIENHLTLNVVSISLFSTFFVHYSPPNKGMHFFFSKSVYDFFTVYVYTQYKKLYKFMNKKKLENMNTIHEIRVFINRNTTHNGKCWE